MPIDRQPDTPIAFGFKTDWLAIKSDSPKAVLAKLPLKNVQIANWQSGFQAIGETDYKSSLQPVFVSPSIRGWVFVVSYLSLPTPTQTESFHALMQPLLDEFQTVQYFGTYRVSDYIAWAKAENGQWQRRFATAEGRILENFGKQTTEEKSLGLLDIRTEEELEQDDIFQQWIQSCDEETPAQLAALWSVNPLELEQMNLVPSTGWLGYIQSNNQ
ncbi:Uncharacterised protein [Alysiella crassa]|uniref:Uncharacterized protein n=2 Tax=Alysiella crassa TaxID=153491 RepID=A0A376BV77_9NEIS|nr:Uncharacterised protein [Alysiella crassa]